MRLADLVKDGKIYLSLSDAIALAIENNYDIAIARYDLDIADTDILRTKTGAAPLGAPSGLVTGTLGGSASTLSTGGGPGGTTVGSGGAGSGVNGLTLTTAGAGPAPETSIPPSRELFNSSTPIAADQHSFSRGGCPIPTHITSPITRVLSPARLSLLAWNNSRVYHDSPFDHLFARTALVFKATVTQHLLQGAGIWVNKRFMYQALNDRRITDSSFRQQILYTVNQVETIYWGLVQAYEMCRPRSAPSIRATNCSPTTASSWKSAPWPRSTWSTPSPP